jgi:lipopolysaccharide transport system ATP-binding protein
MNLPAIEAKNIGKKYSIAHERGRYVALRDVIVGFLKNPLSLLKKKKNEDFWALSGVNFNFAKGEIIGIIGKNGAGKSTLLKILSQITPPTTGEIIIRGRVGSLLEVGTGFHPELTGRENIFLNGAILGMKRSEIARKFDEIVTFASVEKFLDTPVKHYSSGMYVRLAFSIAAHMDPDILIIDEVLAVGDTEFQEKCLGKMNQISKEEGRTVLFISHNLLTIQKLCKKCLLLENGTVKMIGETNDVINAYTEIKDGAATNTYHKKVEASVIQYARVTNIKDSETIKSNDKLKVVVRYKSRDNKPIHDGRIVLTITNIMTQQIAVMLDSHVSALTWTEELPASGEITTETDTINLSEGEYSMNIDFMAQGSRIEYIKNALDFNVITELSEYDYKNYPDNFSSHHLVKHHFKVQG